MSKIFIAFYTGINDETNPYAIPHFYESFLNKLKEYGNELYVVVSKNFGSDWPHIPEKMTKAIQNFNPDLCILFNNCFYDISNIVECPIVIYEVDSPLYYSNKQLIKNNPNRFKFLVGQNSSLKILNEEFLVNKNNIQIIPFFTEIKAITIPQQYNISFIGTKFCKNTLTPFSKFMITNPSNEEISRYKNLLKILKEQPFISRSELFLEEESLKIKNNFPMDDILFLLSDYERINLLRVLTDLGVHIWGTDNWINDRYNEPDLILSYHPEKMYTLKDNEYIYNSSKISISKGHLQGKEGFPWRIFDIMASNSCLVTEYHSNFDIYLKDIKLPIYENTFDAYRICKDLLDNENKRKDIILKAQEVINKNYRFKHIKSIIENFLDINLFATKNGSCTIKNCSIKNVKKISYKNKIRLKIYNHLKEILERKNIIK